MNYENALRALAQAGLAHLAGRLGGPVPAIAALAALPVEAAPDRFVEAADTRTVAWQLRLYMEGHARYGLSHEAILARRVPPEVHMEEGRFWSVGDLRVPPLAARPLSGRRREEVYALARELYRIRTAAEHVAAVLKAGKRCTRARLMVSGSRIDARSARRTVWDGRQMHSKPGDFPHPWTDPARTGIVKGKRTRAGRVHVLVRGGDERVSSFPRETLEPLPKCAHDRTEFVRSHRFAGPEWLRVRWHGNSSRQSLTARSTAWKRPS